MSESTATEKQSTPRAALSDKDEAKVAKAVKSFDDETRPHAERYARKLLKVQQGLRSTPAPRTGLSVEQAKAVRVALGIKDPEKPAKEEAAATES